MRIYLIGFMGAGKTTLGHRVATDMDVSFFDTDHVMEAQTGMSIHEIFILHGEDYFRHLESDILRQTTFYSKSITATGGGLPCFLDNMSWMKSNGITVYLEWPEDLLIQHVLRERDSRPLLADLSPEKAELKIKELLLLRKPFYDQSAITLQLEGDMEKDAILLQKACRYIW